MKVRTLPLALCVTVGVLVSLPSAYAQHEATAVAGATSITFTRPFAEALTGLGVTATQVSPAILTPSIATGTFPISTGLFDLDNSRGELIQSGGLSFTNGTTTVNVQDMIIDNTGNKPIITAVLVVNGKVWGRSTLFDLGPPSGVTLPLKLNGNTLSFPNMKVTLDASAAHTLNSVYGVSQFTPGFDIGTANVTAYVSQ